MITGIARSGCWAFMNDHSVFMNGHSVFGVVITDNVELVADCCESLM